VGHLHWYRYIDAISERKRHFGRLPRPYADFLRYGDVEAVPGHHLIRTLREFWQSLRGPAEELAIQIHLSDGV
jgi:hypothetical protein